MAGLCWWARSLVKLFVFVIATISFLSTLAIAQPSGNVRSYPYTFESGGFSKDGVYSNYCLGFSYQIPVGWEINPRFGGANGKARNVEGWLRILSLHRPNDDLSPISLGATPAVGKAANAQDSSSTRSIRL